MDTTLYYNEWLGLYTSIDWMWLYDPNTQQLYQQVSPGQFQAVQIDQSDPYSVPQSYPQSYPQSQPQPQTQPVYVQPPRVGVNYSPRVAVPQASQPVARPPVVAPPAPLSTQPTGTYQAPPPPRTTTQPAPRPRGSGGTVAMKVDPKQGYWEAINLIGYWKDFGDSRLFYQGAYPVTKVRLTDGRPWTYGALAIYEGRDSKAGIFFLLYDSANESYEPPWKSAGDNVRAVQVRPVLPF